MVDGVPAALPLPGSEARAVAVELPLGSAVPLALRKALALPLVSAVTLASALGEAVELGKLAVRGLVLDAEGLAVLLTEAAALRENRGEDVPVSESVELAVEDAVIGPE